jgi:L-alanine-DL-glutamate epimerase-like enolase superfamily enzyme
MTRLRLLKGWELGCMDAVALKLSKFGGLSAMRRARDLCLHLGAKMCVEDTWGSDITTACLLHLGAATRSLQPARTSAICPATWRRDLMPDVPARKAGRIAPPDGTGLGVSPDMGVLGGPVAVFD